MQETSENIVRVVEAFHSLTKIDSCANNSLPVHLRVFLDYLAIKELSF